MMSGKGGTSEDPDRPYPKNRETYRGGLTSQKVILYAIQLFHPFQVTYFI